MLDNLSLKIEELAAKEGSYIDAMTIFTEKMEYYDFEDLIEVLHPLVVQKIKQEFINKKYIPHLNQKNSIENFFE